MGIVGGTRIFSDPACSARDIFRQVLTPMLFRRAILFAACLLSSTVLWTQADVPENSPLKEGQIRREWLERGWRQLVVLPDAKDDFVFRAMVEEVSLHATVTDNKKRLVTNLGRSAFKVFEDGKPQLITSFRNEDIPVALGIVIDDSASMLEKRKQVNRAALNLVRASNQQDQVFVVNFNEHYSIDQDFTGDVGKLSGALEKVHSNGETALYDVLIASAKHLSTSTLQKRVLVVVTDGEDNSSNASLEHTVELLQGENGPIVYAIGILDDASPKAARNALQTIATKTGGIAFLPKNEKETDKISARVAHDIRNQYAIAYKPDNPPAKGGYRTIRVEAKAHGYKDLTVRTRNGYYAGQQRASR